MSSNTNIGNTPVNQGYVQLIHTGETGGINGTLRTLYDGDGTASDLQIASNKVKVSTELYIGSKTATEFIQDIVGDMFTTGSYTNITTTYDDTNGNIDLNASGDVTLSNTVTLSNKTLAAPTLTGTTQGASITLSGDLTVNGTTTTVNQTNLDVSDNIIGLNRGASSNANDSGLIIERGSTGDNAAIIWDESADKFTLGTTTSTPSATGDLTISTGTLVANVEGNVTGNVTGSASLNLLKSSNLSDLASASTARSNLGVDAAGTDNSTNVTLAGSLDYITLSGQEITRNAINLTTDVTGTLPVGNGGTGLTSISTLLNSNVTPTSLGLVIGTNVLAQQTIGIANDNLVEIDDADAADNDYAKFTANGLEGRSFAEVRSDLGLGTLAQKSEIDDIDQIAAGVKLVAGESFVDSDANLMTAAAINDRIESFGYGTGNGDMTGVSITASDPLDISQSNTTSGNYSATISLDASEFGSYLTDMTDLVVGDTDELAVLDNGTLKRKQIDEIRLTAFDATGFSAGAVSAVANGADNRIATFSSSTALNGESELTYTGGELKVNRSGSVTNKVTITGGSTAVLDLNSTGDSFVEKDTGNSLYIANNAQDKDIILRVNDGGSNVTAVQIDASNVGSLVLPNDNQNLYLGASNDLRIVHDGSNNYINSNTSDQDLYIRVNDGGTMLTAIRTDSSDTAAVKLPNDGQKLTLGASDDLRLQHNGSHSFIQAYGTGDLYFDNNNDNQGFVFRTDDGSGGVTTYLKINGSSERISVKKSLRSDDNIAIAAGTDGDLNMYHNGTNSFLENWNGDLYIRNNSDDKDIKLQSDDGSGGVTDYILLDGSNTSIYAYKPLFVGSSAQIQLDDVNSRLLLKDNTSLKLGTGGDFNAFHNGTNTFLRENTNDLYIDQLADDKDIIFRSDDGSGGVTSYFYLDGSATKTIFPQSLQVQDTKAVFVGNAGDGSFFHNGTNTFLSNSTGALFIEQLANDEDVFFRVSDGGSTITALRIDASENGRIKLPNDNQRLTIGASDDLQLSHESNNNYIATYSGNLILEQTVDDKDIIFNCDNGSGGVTAYLTLDGSLGHSVINKNMRAVDSVKFTVGNADDASFYHDATDTYLENGTGNFYIRQLVDDGDLIFQCDNGSGGNATYLTLDGSATKTTLQKDLRADDDVKIQVGSSGDFYMVHDSGTGQGQLINGTDHLVIVNNADDHDIILKSDNGSGGTTAYLTIDGSATRTNVHKDLRLDNSVNLSLGGGGNMSMSHDGSNATFSNATGNLTIQTSTDDGDVIFKCDDGSGGLTAYITLDGSDTRINIDKKMTLPASHTADKIVMYRGGNEKIGTEANTLLFTADNFKFKDVAGTVNLSMDNAGNLSATADVIAFASSDKRLKDNLKPIENSLEKVSKLSGYEFDWNDKQDTYQGHDVGVIAQEVEEVLPEVVTTRDNGYKAVKYEKIVPLLIQAIKEQQQQIEELKNG